MLHRSVDRNPATFKLKSVFVHASLVGLGGFAGALCRYALAGAVHRGLPQTMFPVGTLCVNLLGCLLIGYLAGLVDTRQILTPEVRIFVFIGFLGGFTTFSTFGYETLALARDAGYAQAALNIGLHVIIGLALVWLGYGFASSR